MTVNGPIGPSCREERLAADPRPAPDAEAPLERPVLLAVLAGRPDEGSEDDDHAEERDGEEQDSGGCSHGLGYPSMADATALTRQPL